MRYCIECGRELQEHEDDLCENCMNNLASSIINMDGLGDLL